MQNKQKQDQSLEIAIINEVTGDSLKDIAVDGAELSIDYFLADGVLKEIPFFGTLYKTFKATMSIRESLFAKKVFKFLVEIKDLPKEKKEMFIKKLEEQHQYRRKVGEN
jgi:hypothetical protein